MPYDGNGNYVRVHNWTADAANSLDINATEMDAEDNGFAAALSNAVTRDGQGKMGVDFLPNADNTLNLGNGSMRWATVNGLPISSIVSGIFYARTPAEITAGVTPAVFTFAPGPPYYILERVNATQAGLVSACSVAALLGAIIVIDVSIAIASNITIPSNVTLKFVNQGQLAVATAITVTYNGYVEAARQSIFALTGTGVVSFSGSFQRTFRPEWWGTVGDGNTDDSTAVIAALTQASASQGTLLLTALHAHASTLIIPNNLEVIGLGRNLATGFRPTGAAQVVVNNFRSKLHGFAIYSDLCTLPQTVVINNGSGNSFNNALEDIYIFGVNQLAGNVCGLSLQESQDTLLSRVRVDIGTGGAGAGSLVGTITGITQGATPTVTINTVSTTNPFAAGLVVAFAGVVGMTQINGIQASISSIGGSSGAWTAVLANLNTSAFTGYSSGGTMTSVAHGVEVTPNAINVTIFKPDIEVATNGILICSNSGDVTIIDPYLERHTTSGIYINNSSASVRIKGGSFLNPSSGQNAITIDLTGPVSNVDIDSPAVFTTGGGVVVINGSGQASNVNIRGVPAGRINNANGYAQVKGSGPFSGVAVFGGSTSATVTFVTPLLNNTNYRISLSPSAAATGLAWGSKTVNGFQITTTTSFTGNVDWTVDQ